MKENAVRLAVTYVKRRPAVVRLGTAAYAFFLGLAFYPQTVMATGVFDKAGEIMKDVYLKILGISTAAAVVTAAVALIMMNFSKNGRTVEESRAWLKRIVITWIILNSLGYVVSYITPYFQDGQWNG